MNLKKGFTLIELLAVIIILAIIALIATPIILDVVEDARKSAGSSEANMILSGINNYCATEKVKLQMNSEYTALCTSDMDKEDVASMVNLGNAEILEIEYTDKLTLLKVKSNGHVYLLQDNKMVEEDSTESPEPEEPSLPESISFAEDSWETIATIVKSGKADQYYNVGDEKEVTIDGYTNGSESTFTVRIANMSSPTECSTEGFSQTACGFVVEFVDIITNHIMNSSAITGLSWPEMELHSFLNTIYDSLSNDIKKVIVSTHVVSNLVSDYPSIMPPDYVISPSNGISDDFLYLLSLKEINNESISSSDDLSRQLDYYKNNNNNKYCGNELCSWWTRSRNINGETNNFYTNDNFEIVWNESGVAPAFRIG